MSYAMNNTSLHPLIRVCGYAAALSLILIPVAVFVVRSGQWREGLMLYGAAGAVALFLLGVFAVLALLPTFQEQRAAIARRALWCVIPAFLLISSFIGGIRVPPIHDISNNLENVPQFVNAAKQRGADSNSIAVNPDALEMQANHYPNLSPIRSSAPSAEVFAIVLKSMQDSGLEVYYQNPAQGVIEAVATTPLMQFKDDVIARVRSDGDETWVDLRSVSRVGRSDFGANYKRLEMLTERINTALSP
ncbi:MAG: hypothetical protein CR978_00725 [Gammaproteobacteria bacterium]|nr:MAG: hypothetical protein CR978_00725 [Gammaproteobacteria bacterium]